VTFEETDYPVRAAKDVKESRKLVKIGYKYATGDYMVKTERFSENQSESFQLQNTIAAHSLELITI
jgi:hypothetical protein